MDDKTTKKVESSKLVLKLEKVQADLTMVNGKLDRAKAAVEALTQDAYRLQGAGNLLVAMIKEENEKELPPQKKLLEEKSNVKR